MSLVPNMTSKFNTSCFKSDNVLFMEKFKNWISIHEYTRKKEPNH